ncbi:MAG: bifunctional 2-polyprenyl-6-hydroxyphenol methylase/3-demethylubiquinol 3-O-methyltransferase UbiG [Gammaproteobacteria bacterium]|nr:bifunctional 2-polyprenyl-6-hydroxyphenol methylase/3-demethylubiquinol 3-O-methyltransferase UbiG [Gammaproteobacteria bacterium]
MANTTEREHVNVDPDEIDKFNDLAASWWDAAGEMKPLHQMNPCRVAYIESRAPVQGKRCLDIGCGGGILSEGLAKRGAVVTGIDMAAASLAVAEAHDIESGLDIRYLQMSAEALAAEEPGAYDIVTCLEVVEHVPDPASLISSCAQLVRPGGDVVLSTINRHPKAFALAIVGAEYVLGILPKGTHDYAKFIQPAELEAFGRRAGLELRDLTGLHYSPLNESFSLGGNVDVNYLAHFHAPTEP